MMKFNIIESNSTHSWVEAEMDGHVYIAGIIDREGVGYKGTTYTMNRQVYPNFDGAKGFIVENFKKNI